jgi:hypothetical protein
MSYACINLCACSRFRTRTAPGPPLFQLLFCLLYVPPVATQVSRAETGSKRVADTDGHERRSSLPMSRIKFSSYKCLQPAFAGVELPLPSRPCSNCCVLFAASCPQRRTKTHKDTDNFLVTV